MSGYVLGGGLGDNTKVIGYGCDNAVAFEVVDTRSGSAELITVDADNEPDLFWGLKGMMLLMTAMLTIHIV